VEWLKVKALSSNPSTAKKKKVKPPSSKYINKNMLGDVACVCNLSTQEAEARGSQG
jgi:hypothetical protein